MHRGLILSLALLSAACAVLSAPAIHAQQPPELTPCPSRPTLANRTRGTQAEASTARQKVYVVKVTYDGADGLPESAKAQLTRRLKATRFDSDGDLSLWFGEIAREAMQNNGYFKALVRPQVGVISSGPMGEQVWLTFHVTEGLQYRVGQVQLVRPHVFPIAELRNQFPLGDGAIFDLSMLREGIDALTALYEAHGYINGVVTPDIQTDDAHKQVSVILQFDEGHQFRVGSVRILGLGQASARSLGLELQPGMVFTPKLVEDFFKQNKSLLPAGASRKKNTRITQDARSHTVAVLLDFRACPETNEEPVVPGTPLRRQDF